MNLTCVDVINYVSYPILSQAQQLVGSTLLVTEEDRPDLEEGEFYTRDLVGMRVILKVCTPMAVYPFVYLRI